MKFIEQTIYTLGCVMIGVSIGIALKSVCGKTAQKKTAKPGN